MCVRAARPNRTPIKPNCKLRSLMWNKVPNNKVEGTVWGVLDDTKVEGTLIILYYIKRLILSMYAV